MSIETVNTSAITPELMRHTWIGWKGDANGFKIIAGERAIIVEKCFASAMLLQNSVRVLVTVRPPL